MDTKAENEMNENKLFDLFIEGVQERQRLEDLYYSSGNPKYLYEIENARERIRSVLKMMGVRQ